MLFLTIALLQAAAPAHVHPPAAPANAEDVTVHLHKRQITTEDLAGPTIAYCERTKQTRCQNWTSAQSGGISVVVCKTAKGWVLNAACDPVKKANVTRSR